MATFPDDSTTIKVYFLYGSKPLKEFISEERPWFGGKLGGHAGIGFDSSEIYNFLPNGKLHIFAQKSRKHALWVISDFEGFMEILGGEADSNKYTIIEIPVSRVERIAIDSLHRSYRDSCPYDYAFFGMRCGAATYDVLAQTDVLPRFGRRLMVARFFYPKRIRKKLLRKASRKGWKVTRHQGTSRRKWERDRFWFSQAKSF